MKPFILIELFFFITYLTVAQSATFKNQINQLLDETKIHLGVWITEPEDSRKMKIAKVFFDSLSVKFKVTSERSRDQTIHSNHKGAREVLLAFRAGKINVDEAEAKIQEFSCSREIAVNSLASKLEVLHWNVAEIVSSLNSKEKYEDLTTFLLAVSFLETTLPESIEI